jgi:hypothetical protein
MGRTHGGLDHLKQQGRDVKPSGFFGHDKKDDRRIGPIERFVRIDSDFLGLGRAFETLRRPITAIELR